MPLQRLTCPLSYAELTVPLLCALLVLAAPALALEDQPDIGETLRIVGGVPADEGSWPSLISLRINKGGGRTSLCGGTVIDRNWVLTAAHCVVGVGGVIAPQAASIVEGTAMLGRGGRRIGVTQVIANPSYRPSSPGQPFDLALLRLAEPSQVEPQALLAGAAAGRVLQPREMATVAGFGATQPVMLAGQSQQVRPTGPQALSPRLLQVNVPVVGLEQCRSTYGDRIGNSHICAGFAEGGRDSCQGDSGGPLFMLGPVGRPVQVGVVSWGSGCAQPGKYGVYTSVASFESFIRQYVPSARFVGTPAASAPAPASQPAAGPRPQPTAAAPPNQPQPARPSGPARPVLNAGQPAPATPPGLVGQVSLDTLPGEQVAVGETITLRIRSGATGTLMVFNIDASGRTTQLFPNRRSAPTPSAFRAATQVRPGSTVVLPGPADGFVLRARPPAGTNSIIAVVAPPDARIEDLLTRNMDLGTIAEAESFFEELGALLEQARARMPLLDSAPEVEIARELAIRPNRPPIPMAERHFTIVER